LSRAATAKSLTALMIAPRRAHSQPRSKRLSASSGSSAMAFE
jgi:hypothetical protein